VTKANPAIATASTRIVRAEAKKPVSAGNDPQAAANQKGVCSAPPKSSRL